jgi:hypothetical protein
MTLAELRLIEKVLQLVLIFNTPETKQAHDLIVREIKLKTLDPRKE